MLQSSMHMVLGRVRPAKTAEITGQGVLLHRRNSAPPILLRGARFAVGQDALRTLGEDCGLAQKSKPAAFPTGRVQFFQSEAARRKFGDRAWNVNWNSGWAGRREL